MNQSFREKIASYGQWTYRGAWALEIFASLIGLATGITLGLQAAVDAQSVSSVDLVLASAPFFMVAIAELTKIPIATLLFSARLVWKPIVLLCLIGLATITFETVSMGLERAVSLRQLRYEEIIKELKSLKIDYDQNAKILSDVDTELLSAQKDYEAQMAQSEKERKRIADRIVEIEKEFEGRSSLPQDIIRMKNNIEELIRERDRLIEEKNKRIDNEVGQFERQRESFAQRQIAAQSAGDADTAIKYERDLRNLANPRPKIDKEYRPKLEALEAQIQSQRNDYQARLMNLPGLTSTQKTEIEARLSKAKSELSDFDKKSDLRRETAQRRIDEVMAKKSNLLSQDSNSKATESVKLSKRISELEKERITFSRTDQVRRLASRIYGGKPEDVTDDQASLVALIWFGSLSLLAALAGPITAIVALSLQRIAASEEFTKASKLSRLLRALLLKWRWQRVRSVNVPVEVPIDREVEKRVEVPVEKVIKEILYVPVLTDDPEKVKQAMAEELPKEVRDLVKMSLKKAE